LQAGTNKGKAKTMTHIKDIYPQFFEAMKAGKKNFEIRHQKSPYYRAGDTLMLRERAEIGLGVYTGKQLQYEITYVLESDQFKGISPGYCALGLKKKGE